MTVKQCAALTGIAVIAVAAGRMTPFAFLSPQLDFFLFRTLDAELLHVRIRLNFRVGEMPVLPEKDVESQAQDAEAHEEDGGEAFCQ